MHAGLGRLLMEKTKKRMLPAGSWIPKRKKGWKDMSTSSSNLTNCIKSLYLSWGSSSEGVEKAGSYANGVRSTWRGTQDVENNPL